MILMLIIYMNYLCTFQEGRTCLHYAALNGYADIVHLLANEGCDIDSKDNVSTLSDLSKYFLKNVCSVAQKNKNKIFKVLPTKLQRNPVIIQSKTCFKIMC